MAKAKSAAKGVSSKRLKKQLSGNVDSISRGSIRRLARRGGIKRVSGLLYGEVRAVLKSFVEDVVRKSIAYTEHAGKKTVTSGAVVSALRKRGAAIYGY